VAVTTAHRLRQITRHAALFDMQEATWKASLLRKDSPRPARRVEVWIQKMPVRHESENPISTAEMHQQHWRIQRGKGFKPPPGIFLIVCMQNTLSKFCSYAH